ncbi:hypothetical protein TRFO_19743 [Tritrichomonas foetus]|uniref:Uncharacterized protein n=1 Tax=Tritrichomonas foetus TaxID=1144522 RepID=A0A1J4KHK6_9EUKA|nr:hypothetical protein TRFO_19743 [Tritrichomonas foetus]|eukprot:OHT10849.1 hypothetical protein TRFO_19743 [Tritrichomonas foetus]
MIGSLPYKYSRLLEKIVSERFYSSEFDIEEPPKQVSSPENENLKNIKFIKLPIVYRKMEMSWKDGNQEDMYHLLECLCEYSQYQPILYSIDFINYHVCGLFITCLQYNSPRNLMIKTLELLSHIFTSPKKQLGNFIISQKNNVIDVLYKLVIAFLDNPPDENFPLIPVFLCLNCISSFSIEGCKQTFHLFFQQGECLVEKIIRLVSFVNIKPICCKLIRSISQMKMEAVDAENLFKFVCSIWSECGKESGCHLVQTINNLLKIIPDKWNDLFQKYNAYSLIFNCLVLDDQNLAVPAIWCIVQLIAQNIPLTINFQYFIDLFQNEDLVQISCWAIEMMVKIIPEYSRYLIQHGLYETISLSLSNYQFNMSNDCIQCLCGVIETKCPDCFEKIVKCNIIELLLDYLQSNVQLEFFPRVINALTIIFESSIVIGEQKIVFNQFEENDGSNVMMTLSNKNDINLNNTLSILFKIYQSILQGLESR